jgi:hypothetical protein
MNFWSFSVSTFVISSDNKNGSITTYEIAGASNSGTRIESNRVFFKH